ncbi:MAG: DNA translocase FtsK 4TM domain-containing protein [bacterium]
MARSARASSRSAHKSGTSSRPATWVRELVGLGLLGCALFLFISLLSYSPETDPGFFHKVSPRPEAVRNLGGPIGSYGASFFKETLGLGSYFAGLLVAVLAFFVMRGLPLRFEPWKLPLALVSLLAFSALLSLLLPARPPPEAGGIVGQQSASMLLRYLHPAGSYLVVVLILVLSSAALGEVSVLGALRRSAAALDRFLRTSWRGSRHTGAGLSSFLLRAWRHVRGWIQSLQGRTAGWRGRATRRHPPAGNGKTIMQRPVPEPSAEEPSGPGPLLVEPRPKRARAAAPQAAGAAEAAEAAQPQPAALPPPAEAPPPKIVEPVPAAAPEPRQPPKPLQAALPFARPPVEIYQPPPSDLLDDPDLGQECVDKELLLENAKVLEQKLKDFAVEGRVTEVHPGPIITLYEYEPAPGVKVNRIVNLADDLALAMKAMSIRIVAPIPGKSVVGIEVPNPKRQNVYLKEILTSETFRSNRWKLPLALGKDIAGKPVCTDLSRMPHLLIAGATGTGKSVCLHSLILSLLFRFSPQEVRFLVIDPKMLELTAYHGIPHLLHPVITDARRASDVLEWAVERMEQRYQLLSEKGVRNIESYNERIAKESPASEAPSGHSAEPVLEEADLENADEDDILPEQGKLPYIVLVIDEMADLMILSGKQIEEAITRLAQMARAAGIHLLLATQRPSVDVLTGIIKANLPTRISFQVSSRIDSRTILDAMGAEKLLGQGDMLFLPPGTSKVRRIHGAYVSEPEIERVVEYLKRYGKPRYVKIPFRTKKSKERDEEEVFEHDEKYDLAVQVVTDTRQASISMLQRKLRVGYNRAARMIERMEQEGIVGPQEGVKPREVLANRLG